MCVFLGVVCECLAININTIYFALQKNNKKTNMRLVTVEECSLQAGCLFHLPFFSSKHTWPSHAQSCSVTRPFERRLLGRGFRLAVPRGMVVCQRKQSLFRSRDGRGLGTGVPPGPLVRKVAQVRCVCEVV